MTQETRIVKAPATVSYTSNTKPPPQPPSSSVPAGWQGISSKESPSGTFIEQIPTGTEVMTSTGGMTMIPKDEQKVVTVQEKPEPTQYQTNIKADTTINMQTFDQFNQPRIDTGDYSTLPITTTNYNKFGSGSTTYIGRFDPLAVSRVDVIIKGDTAIYTPEVDKSISVSLILPVEQMKINYYSQSALAESKGLVLTENLDQFLERAKLESARSVTGLYPALLYERTKTEDIRRYNIATKVFEHKPEWQKSYVTSPVGAFVGKDAQIGDLVLGKYSPETQKGYIIQDIAEQIKYHEETGKYRDEGVLGYLSNMFERPVPSIVTTYVASLGIGTIGTGAFRLLQIGNIIKAGSGISRLGQVVKYGTYGMIGISGVATTANVVSLAESGKTSEALGTGIREYGGLYAMWKGFGTGSKYATESLMKPMEQPTISITNYKETAVQFNPTQTEQLTGIKGMSIGGKSVTMNVGIKQPDTLADVIVKRLGGTPTPKPIETQQAVLKMKYGTSDIQDISAGTKAELTIGEKTYNIALGTQGSINNVIMETPATTILGNWIGRTARSLGIVKTVGKTEGNIMTTHVTSESQQDYMDLAKKLAPTTQLYDRYSYSFVTTGGILASGKTYKVIAGGVSDTYQLKPESIIKVVEDSFIGTGSVKAKPNEGMTTLISKVEVKPPKPELKLTETSQIVETVSREIVIVKSGMDTSSPNLMYSPAYVSGIPALSQSLREQTKTDVKTNVKTVTTPYSGLKPDENYKVLYNDYLITPPNVVTSETTKVDQTPSVLQVGTIALGNRINEALKIETKANVFAIDKTVETTIPIVPNVVMTSKTNFPNIGLPTMGKSVGSWGKISLAMHRPKRIVEAGKRTGMRGLAPDVISAGMSRMRYGKATPMKATKKSWKIAEKMLYAGVPTAEMSKKKGGFGW
jgi:hypothetical protein